MRLKIQLVPQGQLARYVRYVWFDATHLSDLCGLQDHLYDARLAPVRYQGAAQQAPGWHRNRDF